MENCGKLVEMGGLEVEPVEVPLESGSNGKKKFLFYAEGPASCSKVVTFERRTPLKRPKVCYRGAHYYER